MKKILGLLLAMILAIGMCGCSSGTSSVKEYNIDEFLPTCSNSPSNQRIG